MRCSAARQAILDRRLGRLSDSAAAGLDVHLASCVSCAAEERIDAMLDRDLSALAATAPPAIDVTARVLREIDELGALDRREIHPRQLVWAALWVYAFALTLAVMGVGIWLFVPKELPDFGHLFAGLPAAASALAQPILLVLAALKGMGLAALELIELASQLLAKLRPVTGAAIWIAVFGMATVTLGVIGRDLSFSPASPARKEHGR